MCVCVCVGGGGGMKVRFGAGKKGKRMATVV